MLVFYYLDAAPELAGVLDEAYLDTQAAASCARKVATFWCAGSEMLPAKRRNATPLQEMQGEDCVPMCRRAWLMALLYISGESALPDASARRAGVQAADVQLSQV